ncbi:hypothetical protein ILUMI_13589 [Ignelater luminosus]|uniref:Uncharacterized protein n=1 Tax=Ignelater luminosus TaxID=2038154 RepID=A0A8K0CWG3_IGNLU|nr:hypothetical protein ILUMI_13589 [Ignelater luminosus]
MKLLLLFVLCAYFINHLEAKNCSEILQTECNDTEYHSYVDCIRKRMKRSLDCENAIPEPCNDCEETCQQCDCDHCAVNFCQPICTTCCPNNPPCSTNRCCHKTCHAKCKSSTCRSECRRSCSEKIHGGSTVTNITSSEKSRQNITTIINLHNVINNTNIIDIPVHVNNTNINNITLSGSEGSTIIENINSSTSEIIKENCCYVVGPRQCVRTQKYPYTKCFHLRRKVCGVFCKAPIVHEQQREICDQSPMGTSCHQQILYIPQPQPRCAYQPSWPYVSCGMQPQPPFCGGCYLHYNSPFPQLPPPGCSPGCYDDGFGLGPYYRQGPFYRPGYAHAPSCYQIGSCGVYGYGGFPGPYGEYPNPSNPYGGFGYPGYGGFGGFPAFPGIGYPVNTYENNLHFEPIPDNNDNVISRTKQDTQNGSSNQVEVEEPPPSYYPVPFIPQYSAVGYPYVPQYPTYNLPPEVDIQATITHPDKESRYAQITITKQPSKRESVKEKDVESKDTHRENDGGNMISKDTQKEEDRGNKTLEEETELKVTTTSVNSKD